MLSDMAIPPDQKMVHLFIKEQVLMTKRGKFMPKKNSNDV